MSIYEYRAWLYHVPGVHRHRGPLNMFASVGRASSADASPLPPSAKVVKGSYLAFVRGQKSDLSSPNRDKIRLLGFTTLHDLSIYLILSIQSSD